MKRIKKVGQYLWSRRWALSAIFAVLSLVYMVSHHKPNRTLDEEIVWQHTKAHELLNQADRCVAGAKEATARAHELIEKKERDLLPKYQLKPPVIIIRPLPTPTPTLKGQRI